MTGLASVFVGSGRPLVECADLWLARGQRVVGVISDHPEVAAWCERNGVVRIDPDGDQLRFLGREPFEYLFSVINHRLMAPELLAVATRASINYHDSLLPAYAGFNATSWSILDGNDRHGITWHRMAADADSGGLYLQVEIEVDTDDTAFTLEAKCSQEAVRSFDVLAGQLIAGRHVEREQVGARSFHLMSDRPPAANVLDLRAGVARLDRTVRAATFGPDDNPFGLPKLWDGRGPIWVGTASVAHATVDADGTVAEVDGDVLTVAVGGREVRFDGLLDADGHKLTGDRLRERGVVPGVVLPPMPPEAADAATALDAAVRRGERWWVRRLAARRPTRAPGLEPGAGDQGVVTTPIELPESASAALAGRTPEARLAAWVAALALWASTIDDADHVDLDVDLGTVGSDVATLFARRVPLHLSTDTDVSCAQAVAAAEAELATLRRRGTFARDVVARYRELREGPGDRVLEPGAVAVVTGDGDADAIDLAGAACVLQVGTDGSARVVRQSALDDAVVAGVTARWVAALVALLGNPDAPVGTVSLLSADERAVLDGLNATAVPYRADRCIHELFAEQVARTPDATALVSGDASVTFAALDRRANAVARRLVAEGVGPDVLVGICIERSIEMVVGLLGILKAGGAYVPLDPVYPRERLAIMLDDSAAPVLLTRRQLAERLPTGERSVLIIDDFAEQEADPPDPAPAVTPDHLAYTIFTSGSTGRPKGVMVQHGNVSNFFTGMDGAVDTEPGVLLAVTSISFDISVLELFWALTRGFEVIVQSESDRASLGQAASAAAARRMGFGLFYFAADASDAAGAYKVLLDGARFADANGFDAVWTPERHFHPFGGLYPNPAVTSAALATITSRIQIRAGSVVLPLHDPIRVAEEWAVVDNLSGGRVGLSFASGWHANDFVFQPDDFADRRNVMVRHIDAVRRLWRGETVRVRNGEGVEVDIATLPRPIQAEPPMWIASAGSADTFRAAGTLGANVLTNMLGQTVDELRDKIAAYREARRAAGFEGDGIVSVMLHTFIGQDTDEVRRIVKGPFCNYLATSFDLVKAAPWSFPAFRQPSREAAADPSLDPDSFTPDDVAALMDFAFERYFDTAGLFGTPAKAMGLVEQLRGIGVDELACLVDFGVAADTVLTHLDDLAELMRLAQSATVDAAPAAIAEEDAGGVVDQILRRGVTHLQCTPSMVRMLLADPRAAEAFGRLERLLVGGEALPVDLAEQVAPLVGGRMINMYGPTETTVWSTTAPVVAGEPLTIGRPIANTVVRVLDSRRRLVPVGTPGELLIGGAGVVRGYLGRPDLTAERFVDDPYAAGQRLYRTGDLVRIRDDGRIEFLGRSDHQVKVNGYRIELGEIEAVLGRHPAVHEAVVVARDAPGGGSQLAAYVVPSARPDSEVGADVVHQWQRLWDETYAQSARDDNDESVVRRAADARFNIAGWNSTATGEPIPAEEMAEWVDRTVDRLVGLAPTNVLELGCGTGLLLFRMLPHVQHYTAVDVSEHALAQIKAELTDDERRKVDLLQGPADGISLPPGSVDLVVVNSVAQYFPDLAYLERVIERAVACVADGGAVWLGDLRHLALLDAFQAEVQLTQSPADLPAADLRARLRTRVEREGELLIDPLLFDVLAARIPRIAGIDVQLKRGAALNEMTRFRYDVVLRVGATPVPTGDVTSVPAPAALDDVAGLLDGRAVRITGLPNARLASALALAASIDGATTGDVAGLRAARGGGGVDPAALLGLDDRYDVELRWNDDDIATFDATFRPRGTGSPERPPRPVDGAPPALANVPAQATPTALDVGDLRSHLRAHLPEYMVPAAFVVMTALPLTPNGKIDRKALPSGQAQVPVQRAEYAAPTNDLEGTIVRIWQDLLGIDQVGLDDNIFDLGANSLLTVQANNRLSQLLERRISLVSMFQHPTVRTLAAHLGVAADSGDQAASAADRGRSRAEARRMARQGRRP